MLASPTSGWAHCETLELVQGRFGQMPSCPKCRGAKVVRIVVAPDAVLCTDGSNFLAAVAKALAIEHQPVDVQSGWFHALDRNAQSGAKPATLLTLAAGA